MCASSGRPASPRRRNGRSAGDNGEPMSPRVRMNGDAARPFEVRLHLQPIVLIALECFLA